MMPERYSPRARVHESFEHPGGPVDRQITSDTATHLVTSTAEPNEHLLAEVQDLYDRGLYVQAHERATAGHRPLRDWRGTRARVLAGRLAVNLGAPRLARAHHLLAFRGSPHDPDARYYTARALLERRGPLAAWRWTSAIGDDLAEAPVIVQADWLAMRGTLVGYLRDFERAEQYLERAAALANNRAWLRVERAALLEIQDRYDDAVAAARDALRLQPWYRPAVQQLAHLLQMTGRDAEAIDVLLEAASRVEAGSLWAQLAGLYEELGRYADAQAALERFSELSPLMEKSVRQWLAGRRSDAAYHCGDVVAAAPLARHAKDPFMEKIAEHLEAHLSASVADARRVVLPVGFIRQHHVTCAPATLSAISRFWDRPADHLSVAEAICYDGTPAHSERQWAQDNGWVAREFTTTWDAAVALIDRGVPFTFTTVDVGRAHLQAVIGYDGRRRTLLIRDPYFRHIGEALADMTLERYRASGPRAMALVPREQAHLLDGLDLPDAALYDRLHELNRALDRHDRAAAQAALDAMTAADPKHRLTLWARRGLAGYDANTIELLAVADELLGLFRDDGPTQMLKLSCLRQLGRRDARLELLRLICDKKGAHPAFVQQLGQDLLDDAREHPGAERLLRRAIRYRPLEPDAFRALAELRWMQLARDEGTELYRFAACLGDRDESHAGSFFVAARHLRRTEEALRMLRDRFARLGGRSGLPARTLFVSLEDLGRSGEAFDVLAEAIRRRPDDGELLLFAVTAHGRHGNTEEAERLLASADGRSHCGSWLRAAAELATFHGELAESARLWRELLDAEPLAPDAHRALSFRLAETQGHAAAVAHLRDAVERFPHFYPLHELLIAWLRDDGPAAVEPAVRRLLESHPTDPWARRELGGCLSEQRRHAEALTELELAAQLEPNNPSLYNVRGAVRAATGEVMGAAEDFRHAIRLAADNGYAIQQLLGLAVSRDERLAALAFVRAELERQVIFGDGLLAYREHAREDLAPGELLAQLEQARAARPDLWHAWSAVILQLVDMDRLGEAHDIACAARDRFPLLPRLWLDLALVCQLRQDAAGELEALRQARRMNPGWGAVARRLAEACDRQGDAAQARAVLEQAVARTPLDPANHGALADTLWRAGERDAAVAELEAAVRLEPDFEWAWNQLRAYGQELGKPGLVVTAARALTALRGGEAQSWIILARVLPEDAFDERLAAVERAVELNPRSEEARDVRAALLAIAGRYDEALDACGPAACGDTFGGVVPLSLRARAAWIEAERHNVDHAVELMRAVVNEDPNHYWGWMRLAEWYEAMGNVGEYRAVAETMTRRWPHDYMAWTHLAEAQRRSDDRMAARGSYARAARLNPEHAYAAFQWCDLCLADGDADAATEALELLRRCAPGPDAEAMAARLAVLRGDMVTAAGKVHAVFTARGEADGAVISSVEALAATGRAWLGTLDATVNGILNEPDSILNPAAAAEWVRRLAAAGEWTRALAAIDRLAAVPANAPARGRAIGAYVEAAADARRARLVKKFLRKHRDEVRALTTSWASAGYALLTLGRMAEAAAWMADWPQRADVQSWMMGNQALVLRELGRNDEAGAVSSHALTLPRDNASMQHFLWLALDDVLASRTAAARKRLGQSEAGVAEGFWAALLSIVEAVLHVQEAPPAERRRAFREGRAVLAQAVAQYPQAMATASLRRARTRAVWRMARDAGGLWPRIIALFTAGGSGRSAWAIGIGLFLIIRALATA